jgi:hypothetical protein
MCFVYVEITPLPAFPNAVSALHSRRDNEVPETRSWLHQIGLAHKKNYRAHHPIPFLMQRTLTMVKTGRAKRIDAVFKLDILLYAKATGTALDHASEAT